MTDRPAVPEQPDTQAAELAAEQAHLDAAYERLDAMRRDGSRRAGDMRRLAAGWARSASEEASTAIKALEGKKLPAPTIRALWDRGEPSPTYIYRRGDYQSPGAPVEPGTPGEVVATPLNPVYALLRFATGDLAALEHARDHGVAAKVHAEDVDLEDAPPIVEVELPGLTAHTYAGVRDEEVEATLLDSAADLLRDMLARRSTPDDVARLLARYGADMHKVRFRLGMRHASKPPIGKDEVLVAKMQSLPTKPSSS